MSNKKKVIGITGGIATGKSVVTSYLRAHGYEVIDADAVVRELQEVGGALYLAIRDTFGEAYFLKNGELDRATFGALIFSDSAARGKLSMCKIPSFGQNFSDDVRPVNQRLFLWIFRSYLSEIIQDLMRLG
jgi:dephospho-CoA kinase